MDSNWRKRYWGTKIKLNDLINNFKALKESFIQREKYEKLKSRTEQRQKADTNSFKKYAAGKSSFESLFTRSSPEKSMATLETKISQVIIIIWPESEVFKANQDIENLMVVQDMITIILAYHEIEKFKVGF